MNGVTKRTYMRLIGTTSSMNYKRANLFEEVVSDFDIFRLALVVPGDSVLPSARRPLPALAVLLLLLPLLPPDALAPALLDMLIFRICIMRKNSPIVI